MVLANPTNTVLLLHTLHTNAPAYFCPLPHQRPATPTPFLFLHPATPTPCHTNALSISAPCHTNALPISPPCHTNAPAYFSPLPHQRPCLFLHPVHQRPCLFLPPTSPTLLHAGYLSSPPPLANSHPFQPSCQPACFFCVTCIAACRIPLPTLQAPHPGRG